MMQSSSTELEYNLKANSHAGDNSQSISDIFMGILEVNSPSLSWNDKTKEWIIEASGVLAKQTLHNDAASITIIGAVTSIADDAFNGYLNLQYLEFPDSVTSIGNNIFANTLVKKFRIPKNLVNISSKFSFDFAPSLQKFITDPDCLHFSAVDGVLFDKTQENLIFYPSGKPDQVYSVPFGTKTISPNSFADLVHLEQLILPQTITTIGHSFVVRTSIMKSIVIYRFKNGTSSLRFEDPNVGFAGSSINSSAIRYINTDIYVVFKYRSVRFYDVGSNISENLQIFKQIKLDNITIDSLGIYEFMKCPSVKYLSYFNPSNALPLMIFFLL